MTFGMNGVRPVIANSGISIDAPEWARPLRRHRRKGMTLLEVLLALFIFVVGIVGVMGAIPTGITSAQLVIFQDAAIQLAHSKFSEFRRDRADPETDLTDNTYLGAPNASPGGPWRDFPHGVGETYEHFDDIERYEWKLELTPIGAGNAGTPAPPAGTKFPQPGNSDLKLTSVAVVVHMKGTSREFRFTQLMYSYGRIAPYDN
jgi:prepilin-type N-terminal cleavage/methylation domain-containing protein